MSIPLRTLLLDFDGTIADTERHGQRVAYNRAFGELELDWHWDEALYGQLLTIAGGKERLRYYLERFRPSELDAASSSDSITTVHQAKIRHFARISPTIPLRTGVLRLIREAHQNGLAVAIATTASFAGVKALLAQEASLPAMVDLIAANESVERKKPAPDVYQWALNKLRLRAENCIAIEDSQVGLSAARAAGLRTIITVSDYTGNDDFTGASAVLSDLGEPARQARCYSGTKPANGMVDIPFLRSL